MIHMGDDISLQQDDTTQKFMLNVVEKNFTSEERKAAFERILVTAGCED